MTITPDRYQQAVLDASAEGTGNVVVRARAGSGKTSTILGACERIRRGTVGYVVFNKKMQLEAREKFEKRGIWAEVLTLHSLGARACRAEIEADKAHRLARELFPDTDASYRDALRKGLSLAKGMLLRSPSAINALIPEYDLDVLCPSCANAAERQSAPEPHRCPEEEFGLDVCQLLDASEEQDGSVDFDDMIWLPVVRGLRVKQYDRLFIDETQDLNLAQIRLAQMAARGRTFAVGDDRQAIYGFRGADRQAMPRVIRELAADVLPLSVSYRCPRAVVEAARDIVPDIEPASSAAKGQVVRDLGRLDILSAARGDFIISRKNAPLVGLCLDLIRRGTPAVVLGRDVAAELGALIEQSRAKSIPALLDWAEDWRDRHKERAARSARKPDTSRYDDSLDALRAIAERSSSVEGMRAELRRLFTDAQNDGDRVTLMSTHKAKGLEAKRVWLLRDTYSRESIEESNLLYVAITRAQESLFMVKGVGQ